MTRFNLEDYEIVADRLTRFRTEYPNARTAVELLHHWASDNGERQSYICFARIWRDMDDSEPFATGLAQEHTADRGVNLTSPLENCETSALGRALANGGYSPTGGQRPSREEMQKVAAHNTAPQTPDPVRARGPAPATAPTVAVASPPHSPPFENGEGHPLRAAVDLVADQLGAEVVDTIDAPSPTTAGDPTGAARADNAKRIGAKFGVDPKFAGSRKPSSEKQHAMLGKLFNDIGITENTKRLAYVRSLLERPDIGGAGELLSGETSVLIDALKLQADRHAEQGKQSTLADPWANSEPAW